MGGWGTTEVSSPKQPAGSASAPRVQRASLVSLGPYHALGLLWLSRGGGPLAKLSFGSCLSEGEKLRAHPSWGYLG